MPNKNRVDYDTSTGLITIFTPRDSYYLIHPIAAYSLLSKIYFKSWDDFKNQLKITKIPELHVGKNHVLDAQYIIFGSQYGRNIDRTIRNYNFSGEEGLELIESDDLIFYIWAKLKHLDLNGLIKWIDQRTDNMLMEQIDKYLKFHRW